MISVICDISFFQMLYNTRDANNLQTRVREMSMFRVNEECYMQQKMNNLINHRLLFIYIIYILIRERETLTFLSVVKSFSSYISISYMYRTSLGDAAETPTER